MTDTPEPEKHPFRVFFHDGKTLDFVEVHPLVAERKARAAHPGGFVKKIKRLKLEVSYAR